MANNEICQTNSVSISRNLTYEVETPCPRGRRGTQNPDIQSSIAWFSKESHEIRQHIRVARKCVGGSADVGVAKSSHDTSVRVSSKRYRFGVDTRSFF